MFTGLVQDAVNEMVFVDDHRREVPTTSVRQDQPGWLREIDDREAIQGVPIEPDDRLFIDTGGCPVVSEAPDSPGDCLDVSEHSVSLRSHEVVDVHENR